MVTKWDLIDTAERAALERTPLGLPCTGCSTMLATEADFAKHFVLADRQYKNLGECPNTEKGRRLTQRQIREPLKQGPVCRNCGRASHGPAWVRCPEASE